MNCRQIKKRYFIFALSFFAASLALEAADTAVFKLPIAKPEVLKQYSSLQATFSKEHCSPKVEPHFNKLFSQFQRTRYLIPVNSKGELDDATVRYILPRLQEKARWIASQKIEVGKVESFAASLLALESLQQLIDEHQKIKYQHSLSKKFSLKKKYRLQAESKRLEIVKLFQQLAKEIPFLLSLSFPVDHLKSRVDYDRLKEKADAPSLLLANQLYMERKLVEDGAQDANGKRSDLYLRSTFETVYLSLSLKRDFLTEEERYDLLSLLSMIRSQLKSGKKTLMARLDEWEKRTNNTYSFYQHLFDKVKDEQNGPSTLAGVLLRRKAASTYDLKKFVLEKQRDAFAYWASKDELYRALFVLETILFNEVGNKDPYKVEREDIVRLVINRHQIPYYSRLSLDDALSYYLPHDFMLHNDRYPWLNALFKEGEFSFTYFYIPGSVRIFCPDMTKTGRRLRQENVAIALDLLLEKKRNFTGLRYFSRESMIGRIDMAKVWENFEAIGEGPAVRLYRPDIWKHYRQKKFEYLYSFNDEQGRRYDVVTIADKEWVIDPKRQRVYGHRNPHQFTFFRLK